MHTHRLAGAVLVVTGLAAGCTATDRATPAPACSFTVREDVLPGWARAGFSDASPPGVSGGPGPSVLDLPRPGCWHLTLTWGDRSDTLDLRYAAAGSVEGG